jgi:hypothetical protein
MTAAVGLPTLRLIRAAIGPWALEDLGPGQVARGAVAGDAVSRGETPFHTPPIGVTALVNPGIMRGVNVGDAGFKNSAVTTLITPDCCSTH